MPLVPISIKFEPGQREWLQAQANLHHKGRISKVIKSLVDSKIKRTRKEVQAS